MVKRFLIATQPEARERLRDVLNEEVELVFVSNVRQAIDQLEFGFFDLILCTMQFDDSRLFEFLSTIKVHNHKKHIPFFCVKVRPSQLIDALDEDLKATMLRMGVAEFLQLSHYQEKGTLGLHLQKYLNDQQSHHKHANSVERIYESTDAS